MYTTTTNVRHDRRYTCFTKTIYTTSKYLAADIYDKQYDIYDNDKRRKVPPRYTIYTDEIYDNESISTPTPTPTPTPTRTLPPTTPTPTPTPTPTTSRFRKTRNPFRKLQNAVFESQNFSPQGRPNGHQTISFYNEFDEGQPTTKTSKPRFRKPSNFLR